MTSLFSLLLRGNMEKYLSIFIGKFLKPKCLETNWCDLKYLEYLAEKVKNICNILQNKLTVEDFTKKNNPDGLNTQLAWKKNGTLKHKIYSFLIKDKQSKQTCMTSLC